MKGSEKAVTLH